MHKEFLNDLRNIYMEIDTLNEEIYMLENLAGKITPTYSDEIKAGGISDKVGNGVIKIVMLKNETNDLIAKYVAKKELADKLIEKLEKAKHRIVLRKRYICNKTWEQITEEMEYSPNSRSRVVAIHEKALMEFEKLFRKVA